MFVAFSTWRGGWHIGYHICYSGLSVYHHFAVVRCGFLLQLCLSDFVYF